LTKKIFLKDHVEDDDYSESRSREDEALRKSCLDPRGMRGPSRTKKHQHNPENKPPSLFKLDENIVSDQLQHNLVPPRSDKLPPPVSTLAVSNSYNAVSNSAHNKPVKVNATTFNNIMQRLNDFLKRRPTLESLKRDGIIKG
jgi:hypothetical protein